VIPKPRKDQQGKVQGEFYPLQKAELIALRQAKLINNAAFVHLALRYENPFCDRVATPKEYRSITVIPKEFAIRWLLPESSVYEAIGKLKESNAITIKSGKFTIEWVDYQQEENSENPEKLRDLRKNSENPEKILESQKINRRNPLPAKSLVPLRLFRLIQILMGERCRTQQLTNQGVRKPKNLRLYCTYTIETNSTGTSDAIEKILSKLERSWKSFTGEINELQFIAIERLLHASFTDGFQLWEQLLSNKMGLDIRPINADTLWSELWQRFNNTPPRPIPQLLTLDESGLREEIHSDVAPTSFLMESESSIPIADRRWVHLQEKYIAALTFVEKPGGWADKERQMHYLWEVLSRERVYDTEIYCQLMRASETLVKTNMQRLTKQANTSATLAQNKNSVDVKSLLNIKKSVAAQEELYEGAVPIHVATVFLVYRKTREQLDPSEN
jgi:hypothetical protein